ncbi:anhydro-N-acetylmuramic acid kinase [Mycobacterium noviomagense]|uniref:Anhydro-N-acetylmuramic acid kinase n=2 Tax=Mycobacterium noviomagense TaxID=459858 RepID=A0ABX3T271_9MYCO|nr:anhydro-N-acetylmuramic acid kinase [Mycobacterium noviomagense]ORB12658.1 anhydro-N-acetylmuramic acid kinase [Mycobacterium noviomagense]
MKVIGLMSGTSMDGLDAAVAEFEWDGAAVAMSPLRHIERPWPDEVRARLHASLGPTTAAELCQLDQLIGQASAELATELLPADFVVSHGQTVHHWVHDRKAMGTLQLGQPAWIVEATGLPVVSDVRARDIAAGGHGAPLAGILDDLWLRGDHTRAALNLGGIANVTIVRPGRPPIAFDTGPGNCLLDEAARRTTGQPQDKDGRLAARGEPDAALLEDLLDDPYYALAPPKSTGREHFHLGELPDLSPEDLLATLTELTAITVADALAAYAPAEVVASGGGVRNPALHAALQRRLPLTLSDERGLPAQAKEAYLMALIGFLACHQVPLLTGPHVLGRISPGDAPLALPRRAAPPTGLLIRPA